MNLIVLPFQNSDKVTVFYYFNKNTDNPDQLIQRVSKYIHDVMDTINIHGQLMIKLFDSKYPNVGYSTYYTTPSHFIHNFLIAEVLERERRNRVVLYTHIDDEPNNEADIHHVRLYTDLVSPKGEIVRQKDYLIKICRNERKDKDSDEAGNVKKTSK